MSIYKDFIIFILGFLVIIKSADLFTNAAESIAVFFKIPRVIIGLTIVSMATTFPEFTVSAISSFMGASGIAVGNVTGSFLVNISLVLAIAIFVGVLHFNPGAVRKKVIFLICASVFALFLMWDGTVNRIEGLLLCSLSIAFFGYIVARELKTKKNEEKQPGQPGLSNSIIKEMIIFILAAAGVVLSAKWAVIPSSINIAHYFKIPEIVIGITIVAIGTSLPELVTAVVASLKKMGELALGNVIGANILNILWILGFSAVIRPLSIDQQTKFVAMPLAILFTVLIFVFTRKKFTLTKGNGLVLFFLYAGYIFYIIKFAYN